MPERERFAAPQTLPDCDELRTRPRVSRLLRGANLRRFDRRVIRPRARKVPQLGNRAERAERAAAVYAHLRRLRRMLAM